MSGSSITYSETMSQTEPPSHERRIDIAGAYNVRDLGGYPTVDGRATRRGHFIRADACRHFRRRRRRPCATMECGLSST